MKLGNFGALGKKVKGEAVPSLADTVALAKRYLIQETIGPLKSVGRILGFGLAGSFLAALGAALCLLGVLRLFQGETGTTFAGGWTFAPYLLTAVVGVVVIVAAVAFGLRRSRGGGSERV